MTKLLPQAEPVDCEAWFLKTLHTSDQWTLWKSFVGFRCRIEVNFAILFTSKEIFHGVTVRRRAGRPEVAPGGPTRGGSGGIFWAPDKGISWDAWTSGIAAPKAEFRFRVNQSRRSSCWNLQQQERQTAADSGRQLRALLIRVVR